MSFLWDAMAGIAGQAGSAVAEASYRTKVKTELMLVERELLQRKQTFGVEMYDYVAPLSKHPSFYSSDDTLTVTLQPPLITAQREIAALQLKHGKVQNKMQQAAQARASTFTTPATNWQEKVINMGKSTVLAGNEAVNGTEQHLIHQEMKHYKQQFGVNLYTILEELEDSKQWLPTDREIRSIYDNCRREIEKIKKRKHAKELELKVIDGTATAEEAAEVSPDGQPAVFASAYPQAQAPPTSVQAPHLGVQRQAPAVVGLPPVPAHLQQQQQQPAQAYGATSQQAPYGQAPQAPVAPADPFGAPPQAPADPFAAPAAPPNMFSYPGQSGTAPAPAAAAPSAPPPQQSMFASNDPFASLGSSTPSSGMPPAPAMNGGMQQGMMNGMQQSPMMGGMQQSGMQQTPMMNVIQQQPMNGMQNTMMQQPNAMMNGMQQPAMNGGMMGDPFAPSQDPFAPKPPSNNASSGPTIQSNFVGSSSTYDDPFANL